MHLHIVFVLLYSICHSVNVLSCVDVIQCFTYLLRVIILDVTKRRCKSARESERRYQRLLVDTIPSKKNQKKSGCGSFVVAYFQPATSIDRLLCFLLLLLLLCINFFNKSHQIKANIVVNNCKKYAPNST